MKTHINLWQKNCICRVWGCYKMDNLSASQLSNLVGNAFLASIGFYQNNHRTKPFERKKG